MSHAAFPTRIRRGERKDLGALSELLAQLFAIEADFVADPDKQVRGLEQLMSSPGSVVWIAEEGGTVVGMLTVQTLISTAEGGPVGLVEDVVVREGWRGLGLGRRLISAAEAWAKECGLTRLQLLADRQNQPALEFYEKLGWSGTNLLALRKFPLEVPRTESAAGDL